MTVDTLLGALPVLEGKEVLLVDNQQIGDLIHAVLAKHRETMSDYNRICSSFFVGNPIQICEKIFAVCKKLPYREESVDWQTVRTPTAILSLADVWGVDCKHYAGFIGGILDALNRTFNANIRWCYRFAAYGGDIKHVFVVVKLNNGELWVDPVLGYLNCRTPSPSRYIDKCMALVSISGIDEYGEVVNYRNPFAGESGYAVGVVEELIALGIKLIPSLISFFSSKYTYSGEVRHLIEKYEFKVLGIPIHSRQDVDESLIDAAQQWFYLVLGVPIYDYVRVGVLMGDPAFFPDSYYSKFVEPVPFNPFLAQQAPSLIPPIPPEYLLKQKMITEYDAHADYPIEYAISVEDSVNEFLRLEGTSLDTEKGGAWLNGKWYTVTVLDTAAILARTLFLNLGMQAGEWKDYTIAPTLSKDVVSKIMAALPTHSEVEKTKMTVDTSDNLLQNTATILDTKINTMDSSNSSNSPVEDVAKMNIVPIVLIGGALLLLSSSGKKRMGTTKRDTNSLLLIGGLGLAAVFLLKKDQPSQSDNQTAISQQQQALAQLQQQQSKSGNLVSALPGLLDSLYKIGKDIFGNNTNSAQYASDINY